MNGLDDLREGLSRLKLRLAKGEISRAEYETLRNLGFRLARIADE